MSSANENEITGDWNNLKGTKYHLVYALWLLLYRKVASVAFYLGNDLLARPIVPPLLRCPQTLVTLQVQLNAEEDEWIQLKATEKSWSISAMLRERDNLLANFIRDSRYLGHLLRNKSATRGTDGEGEQMPERRDEVKPEPGGSFELGGCLTSCVYDHDTSWR